MRKISVFFLVAFALAWASSAQAQLSFTADFARDGAYENSWPMKAGEVISVDIYVSNVPPPGLIAMGFKLTYDASRLEVVPAGTAVAAENWPIAPKVEFIDADEDGQVDEIDMVGFRMSGQAGDNIRLGTVTFRCIDEGISEFMLLTRGENVEGFVLDVDCDPMDPDCNADDPSLRLDGDIGEGVLLATIREPVPGNVNGDGLVDLADAILALRFMAKMQTPYVHGNADVNADGLIGMAEAVYILQTVSGLRP